MSDRTPEPVTVIGLGAMGAAMATTLLTAGHPVTVWNRTAAKAEPLVARGATLAASPTQALAAGELVVLSLVDYAAMDAILGDVDPAALRGRVLANLSSDTPERLRAAHRWAAERGAVLLTGGIMVPPPGIGQPEAYTFYAGDEAVLDAHREALSALSRIDYRGEDPGLAMLWYQAMIAVFWLSMTGYFHSVALLETAGVPAAEVRPYVAELLGGLAADSSMGFLNHLTAEIENGVYDGEFNNLDMQVVGARHVVDAFADAGLSTSLPTALWELFRRTSEAGHGAEGLTSVIELVRRQGE
ncbi:NAD(P)-dependent oxidoreductase [Streptomyces sp. 8K308]|uniref:NAD(P)-dependent oxidoreductase n=1 Tax=Streptomyces sp. 8K308 TaxID=2530388 RepID=UPI001049FAF6|nr:NAD(P)-binding domain-containing protein [Streptomyces sp. 8K308]TDC24726.1 NAD(P)-dependent oxidoreductase [Streptomyces sp. 8K308]